LTFTLSQLKIWGVNNCITEKKRLNLAFCEATRWRFPPAKEVLSQDHLFLVKID